MCLRTAHEAADAVSRRDADGSVFKTAEMVMLSCAFNTCPALALCCAAGDTTQCSIPGRRNPDVHQSRENGRVVCVGEIHPVRELFSPCMAASHVSIVLCGRCGFCPGI